MNKWGKILGAVTLVLIGVVAFSWGRKSSQPPLSVELNKQMYNQGEEVRITIRNNSFKQACFSSCYPYYLQRKEGEWENYNYPSCPEQDVNIPCISASETKKFKFNLFQGLHDGLHRLAIPINERGEKGKQFEEDRKVHTDPFEVK